MSKRLNARSKPVQDINPEEITIAAGVTHLNEVCALLTCNLNQNDAIMLGSPVYGGFNIDLTARTGAVSLTAD
jgi:1-aminocyclopropane-1-carboxylate synthase